MSTVNERMKDTKKESEELAGQIDAIRADLSSLTKSVSRLTRAGISDAQDVVRDKADDARDYAVESFGELEGAVRRNPLQASMVAVGLGFLIGLMARR